MLSLRIKFGPAEENEWEFGQIFPLVLLAAPITTVFDHWPNTSHQAISDRACHDLVPSDSEVTLFARQESSQWTDKNYESSSPFRVGSVLIGLSYLYLVILVLITDAEGLSNLFSRLAFAFFCFYPGLQATWFLYALWIPKLDVKPQHRDAVLGIVFLTIILLKVVEMTEMVFDTPLIRFGYGEGGKPPSPVLSPGQCIAILFATYLLFVGWFQLVFRYKDDDHSWIQKALSRFLTFAVSTVIPGTLAAFNPWNRWAVTKIWAPVTFGGQLAVQLFEAAICAWVPAHRRVSFRVWALTLCLLGTQGVPWASLALSLGVLFYVLLMCPIWVAFWIFYEALQKPRGTTIE